jgi:dTDP-4-amino-4,6-dideoxygalactose transaminase
MISSEAVKPAVNLHVPFVDLKLQYQNHRTDIDKAIQSVVDSAAFLEGPEVKEFESNFASYCGTRESVALDSGTAALHLALAALGIRSGDEVIIPTNTFIATAAAVAATGARPVFVDADPRTWLMDLNQAEAKINPKTRGITAVHLYGNPMDMEILLQIAQKRHVPVIEDACQAHGAIVPGGKRAGAVGEAGCFSFYPAKNLGAFGDGGLATTNDPVLADRMRRLRNHGRLDKYKHAEAAFNCRMDTIQAAVLKVKLQYLDSWNRRRRELAASYRRILSPLPLQIPEIIDGAEAVHHLFPVCVQQRDAVSGFLKQRGIETGVHYPIPLHLQPAFRSLGHKSGDFPVSEKIASETLSLPIFPEMTNEQLNHVCESMGEFFRSGS